MPERTKAIVVRLTEKEKLNLQSQAKIAGLKMEPFVRKLIAGSNIMPRPPGEYVRLVREVNAIGNNINQIAHIANAESCISAESIKRVQQLQSDIVREMRRIR